MEWKIFGAVALTVCFRAVDAEEMVVSYEHSVAVLQLDSTHNCLSIDTRPERNAHVKELRSNKELVLKVYTAQQHTDDKHTLPK